MLLLAPVDEGPELEPEYALHVHIIRILGRAESLLLIPAETSPEEEAYLTKKRQQKHWRKSA